jgi:hypothetical protein
MDLCCASQDVDFVGEAYVYDIIEGEVLMSMSEQKIGEKTIRFRIKVLRSHNQANRTRSFILRLTSRSSINYC